jgi:hypothetical protein
MRPQPPQEVLLRTETLEELAQAIGQHLRTCPKDHSGWRKQVTLVTFIPALSRLNCNVCGEIEYLFAGPGESDTLDEYVCNLLTQQQRFFDRHFASCIVAKAIA